MAVGLISAVIFCGGLLSYYAFGYFSKTLWRAVTYSFLWGVAVFVLLIALGMGTQPLNFDVLVEWFALHQAGAIIITVLAYLWGRIHDAA